MNIYGDVIMSQESEALAKITRLALPTAALGLPAGGSAASNCFATW